MYAAYGPVHVKSRNEQKNQPEKETTICEHKQCMSGKSAGRRAEKSQLKINNNFTLSP
jgi:hypothetical protein